jgi:hypothetical protein
MEVATLAPPPRSPRSVIDEYCASAGEATRSAAARTVLNVVRENRGSLVGMGVSSEFGNG